MLIKIRKSWEMRESEATPEAVFHDRRRLVKSIAATPILASAGAAQGVFLTPKDQISRHKEDETSFGQRISVGHHRATKARAPVMNT